MKEGPMNAQDENRLDLRVSRLEDEVNAVERQIEEMREEIRALGRVVGEALGLPERSVSE
jgi:chaperonin cofactor prefoldin